MFPVPARPHLANRREATGWEHSRRVRTERRRRIPQPKLERRAYPEGRNWPSPGEPQPAGSSAVPGGFLRAHMSRRIRTITAMTRAMMAIVRVFINRLRSVEAGLPNSPRDHRHAIDAAARAGSTGQHLYGEGYTRAGALRAERSDTDAVAPARAQLANGGGKRRLVASAPRRGTRATGVAAASVFRAA